MRHIVILLTAVLLVACKSQPDKITVYLSPEPGYGPFNQHRLVVMPGEEPIDYKGVPDNIKEYEVREFSLQWEAAFVMECGNFSNIFPKNLPDKDKTAKDTIGENILFLIGTDEENKRFIIVDSKNDNNFEGEKILEYEYPLETDEQLKISRSLPVVSASYDYVKDGMIKTSEIKLMPNPYRGGISLRTADGKEMQFYLFVNFPEYRKGMFEVNNIKYDVVASNKFVRTTYDNEETFIFINKQNEPGLSELEGDIPYRIGDIFNAEGFDYKIVSISEKGDKLVLKYLGKNPRPVGLNEGLYLPDIESIKTDSSYFSNDDFAGKYTLLYFWGTWCSPCIKQIPTLKELNLQFKDRNFMLVGAAFDSSIEKVREVTENENMDWTNLFINRKDRDENSITETLQISSYPSTILVSPEGKIISRSKGIGEIKNILTKKFELN